MPSDVIQKLKGLKNANGHGRVSPDALWIQETRSHLMAQVRNTTTQSKKSVRAEHVFQWLEIFMPHNYAVAARRAFVFLLVLGVAAGGWSVGASASQDSLPGDALWKVKLATEKLQEVAVSVVGSNGVQVAVKKKILTNRVEEIKKLSEKPQEDYPKRIKQAKDQLKTSVASVNKVVGGAEPGQAVQLALEVSQTTQEASKVLKEAGQILDGTPANQGESQELSQEIDRTTKEFKKDTLAVIADAVQKQMDSGSDIGIQDENKIKKVVTDTLDELSGEIDEEKTKDIIEKAKQNSEVARSGDVGDTQEDVSSTTDSTVSLEFNSSTPEQLSTSSLKVSTSVKKVLVTSPEEIHKEDVNQAIQVVNQTSQEVRQLKEEITTLTQTNQLVEALERTKTLNDVTAQAKEGIRQLEQYVKKDIVSDPPPEDIPNVESKENGDISKETTVQENTTTTSTSTTAVKTEEHVVN
ncbi:MAG: hypothetical protein COV59_05830 [Candidatus Magasanikbacteria bacterium CG11_big_fil_rev_8_21_14_0_20_39_34]|uniref:DUF5667 domain-containing protein n=1 Tax=Candidatus Magasanikbacteria bacterium CG11_big_fil_rev_8_21_14_0_20_39_34 TaxID=1974653 RepID=A0A2H0N455_9BACT|nr:MAG: hypothetical protein COV59_05830 [Candidatus Magasanikbacteria bacterium CG11_big_fil_rev_8_21_14_0_20_39_34]